MKRLLYIFAIAALALTGCQKDNQPTLEEMICGEWRGAELVADAGIYISFISDGTFELYQKSGTQVRYTKFTGTCRSEGQVLSGVYGSGAPWGDSYTALVSGGMLVLTSSDGVEVQEYTKESLSQEDKLAANISTRASDETSPIL